MRAQALRLRGRLPCILHAAYITQHQSANVTLRLVILSRSSLLCFSPSLRYLPNKMKTRLRGLEYWFSCVVYHFARYYVQDYMQSYRDVSQAQNAQQVLYQYFHRPQCAG